MKRILKPLILFAGALFLTLTLLTLLALIINPATEIESPNQTHPLHVFLDTSISFYDHQAPARAFMEKIAATWQFPINFYTFASNVSSPEPLQHASNLPALTTFEQKTYYAPLAETLKFIAPQEPKIILSDFIFDDYFNPDLPPLTYFYNLADSRLAADQSPTATTPSATPATKQPLPHVANDFAVFIENQSSDYRPSAYLELNPTKAARNAYPFTVRLTLYANVFPTPATLTLKTLAPSPRTVLATNITLTQRIETLDFQLTVPPAPTLTLAAELTTQTSPPIKRTDSLNLLGDDQRITVLLFAFKPYKDVGLIKRTLKRYGFFNVTAYNFLRQDQAKNWLGTLEKTYANAVINVTTHHPKLSSTQTPSAALLVIALGAPDEALAFFRTQPHSFINLPKIELKQKDIAPFDASTFDFNYNFLDVADSSSASKERWNELAPFMWSQTRPPPPDTNAKLEYYQRYANGASFFFRKDNEIYIGLNGFYELNNALVTPATFAQADVFWVRLLEYLYAETTVANKEDYPHNYFLGQPIQDPYLRQILPHLLENTSGGMTISPRRTHARAYNAKNNDQAAYYHYRTHLREYYPFYRLDPQWFATSQTILTTLAELNENYERNKTILFRKLRTYQFPYILLLLFFLAYLLSKGVYATM